MLPETWQETVKFIAFIILASIGGLLGHLANTLERRLKFNIKYALLETMSAGFVGLLVMLLCQEIGISEKVTGIAVGIFGWLGANASIRILEKIVFSRLGISYDKIKERVDD